MMSRRICAAFAGSLFFAGCSAPEDAPLDARATLVDLTGNVMMPTLEDVASTAEALREASSALEADPSAKNLDATQAAWRASRLPWRHADAFRFGPVVTQELEGAIDWWPAKPDAIEKVVGATTPLDVATIDALGANAKGFLAIEYLLFDNAGGDEAILGLLSGEVGARRRTLAAALAENLAQKTAALRDAWHPAKGDFAGEVSNAGAGSKTFPNAKAAIDELVNVIVYQVETVLATKIGKPFGKQSGGQLLPEAEETPRSDNSIDDMLGTLRGIEAIYEGRYGNNDGLGLSDVVRHKSADVDGRVRSALNGAMAAVSAIPPPFRTALGQSGAKVEAAWQACRTLKRVLATEVVGLLGVTLKFNDNDGD